MDNRTKVHDEACKTAEAASLRLRAAESGISVSVQGNGETLLFEMKRQCRDWTIQTVHIPVRDTSQEKLESHLQAFIAGQLAEVWAFTSSRLIKPVDHRLSYKRIFPSVEAMTLAIRSEGNAALAPADGIQEGRDYVSIEMETLEQETRFEFALWFMDANEEQSREGNPLSKSNEWELFIDHMVTEYGFPPAAEKWKCPKSLKAVLARRSRVLSQPKELTHGGAE